VSVQGVRGQSPRITHGELRVSEANEPRERSGALGPPRVSVQGVRGQSPRIKTES